MAVPSTADLRAIMNLPPKDAIAYLQGKGFAITWDWHDVDAATHARSFTVAKGMRLDILQDIRNGLVDNLQQGKTLRDFQKNLTPLLQAKGWWGKQIITNAQGDAQQVQLGSPRRLSTIYQTNMQSAYMAGRYSAALEATDTHPYWMYVAVNDSRTRPSHSALHGKVWRWDDPIWQTLLPPNGFNCRCRIIALSEAEVKSRGIPIQTSAGKLSTKTVEMGVNETTGEVRQTQVTVLQTTDAAGKLVQFSPDPGFNGGPSQSHLLDNQIFAKAQRTLGNDAGIAEMQTLLLNPIRQQGYEAFVDNARRFELYVEKEQARKRVDQNKLIGIGVMTQADIAALATEGVTPHSGLIYLRDALLVGPKFERHRRAGNALTPSEFKQLPAWLAAPDAVYRQTDNNNLVYIKNAGDGQLIKVVVRANRQAYAKQGIDDVVTAFKVEASDVSSGVADGLYVQIR